ncbi:MAG: chemoreceptor glutamine deamidase CheD, partial [Gammaproteobacteria bacterium]
PPALPGFEGIKRYWDHTNGSFAAKIMPGEYYVTSSREVITTVLGSCISACIRDPRMGVAGMNHFMLPNNGVNRAEPVDLANRYGAYAMEHLINDLLKLGARRDHLEIKLFGGGRMFDQMSDIGRNNIEFVHQYLATEGYPVTTEDLGGPYPRKVLYFPANGKVRVKKLTKLHNNTLLQREERYLENLKTEPISGSIDLF